MEVYYNVIYQISMHINIISIGFIRVSFSHDCSGVEKVTVVNL